MNDKTQRPEAGRMDEQQMADVERMLQAETEQGLTTNVGFSNPGSMHDWAGTTPNPSAGGVGALDPAGGGDIAGDDQGHERNIISSATPTVSRDDDSDVDQNKLKERNGGGSTTAW